MTILFALAVALAVANEPGQSALTLSPGSFLPSIEGESLSGKRITLPEEDSGRISLLVFTFSRKAGYAARAWAEAFAKLEVSERDASSYRILVLGGVPRILRGLVIAGIKKGMPASLHDTTVKLFTDEDSWKARLGVRSPDEPHLLILDREGKVRWLYAGTCDDASVRLLAEQLRSLAPQAAVTTK